MRLVVLALGLSALLSSCAYVNPLVGTVRTARGDYGGATMPLLAAALKEADGRITEMEDKRDATVRTARVLDLLTFGFAGSAAYAALSSNHAQSVRNAGFAAAATYAGGSLFAPMDVANIYHNGAEALKCVADRGATLSSAVATFTKDVAEDEAAKKPLSLAVGGCNPDAAELAAALSAQDKVKRVLAHAANGDMQQATRVRQATNTLVHAVNSELLKRSNSSDAIWAAARSLGFGPAGTVIDTKKFPAAISRGGAPICSPEVNREIRNFTASYNEIDKVVTAHLNVMGALDTCVLNTVAIEPLALSQEEVTVTQDASFNVIISGGRLPYLVEPEGAVPANVSVRLVEPRTIVITGLSGIQGAGGPFTFRVRDNSAVTTPKTLKVSTK